MSHYYQDGQVYRRGKRVKKWKGRLRIYYRDGSVKRSEVILGLCSKMSKSEARTKLREMIFENGSRPSPVLHDITFGEYWRDHYVPFRRSGWSEPTEAGYSGYMKFLILPTLEHIALKDIDHVILANYFAGLKGRCGFWTLKKIRMLLKSIFEEAVNDDLVSKNPMRRLPLPNTADPEKPVLEKADAARVLKAMEDDKSKTGIRDYAITRIGRFARYVPRKSSGFAGSAISAKTSSSSTRLGKESFMSGTRKKPSRGRWLLTSAHAKLSRAGRKSVTTLVLKH